MTMIQVTDVPARNMHTACNNYRSLVPDLLFEDVQEERIDEIRPYLEQLMDVDERVPLHRLTVFLTYACNLDCPYCKTIARSADELRMFPQKAHQFDMEAFRTLLDSLLPAPIRHLHFTGGEAALLNDLPAMVRYAREMGVDHISVTTNGTLPERRYASLVASGINEIRVSIDARDAELGEALTGRKRAWPKAVDNLRFLSSLRSQFPGLFLIANTVVTAANRAEIGEIVRFLAALRVNDIKLITVVQEKGTLGDFPEASAVVTQIEDLLREYPTEAFPLLRRKLRTVFNPDSIGLSEVTGESRRDWRCYIPLTERTVDSLYYYPCSVYLREGGTPLGRIDDPQEVQRAKTAEFVRNGNCLDDPICSSYCLHCTRAYNVAANAARGE